MAIEVQVVDGGTGKPVRVSLIGSLAVGPPSFNLAVSKELGTADTAVNFYEPRGGKQFIVTHIYAYGDKQVSSVTNATVDVYEATNDSTATIDRTIFQFEIGQNEFQPRSDLNLLVNKDRFINAKTSDDDVHVQILGFFIDDTGIEV